jgi:hypothetical protein
MIFLTVILSSCDWGLAIVDMELITFPDKLLYVALVDDLLILDGGTVEIITKDRKASYVVSMCNEWEVKTHHNIDFNKEGIYVVNIVRGDPSSPIAYVSFPVQVVTQEEYDAMMGQEE